MITRISSMKVDKKIYIMTKKIVRRQNNCFTVKLQF